MQINKLKSFVVVAETHHFSKAAEQLFLNQSTVSKHIQYVEQKVGKVLFVRGQRTTELTHDGELFYPYAKQIVDTYEQAMRIMDGNEAQQKVVIGATLLYGDKVLPKVMRKVYQSGTKSKIKLNIANSKTIMEQLDDGTIDIAVVSGYIDFNRKVYQEERIGRDQLKLIAPKGHWDRHEITLDELKRETFIIKSEHSSLHRYVLKMLKGQDATFSFDELYEIGSQNSIVETVKLGQGVSIVSSLLLDRDSDDEVEIHELNHLNLEREICCLYRKDRTDDKIKAMVKLMKQC